MSRAAGQKPTGDDTARAIRFLAVKAAVFIGIPLVAAAIAVIVFFNR